MILNRSLVDLSTRSSPTETAREALEKAKSMSEDAKARRDAYLEIYTEQKALADRLREEQRRNHFSELFQQLPLREE